MDTHHHGFSGKNNHPECQDSHRSPHSKLQRKPSQISHCYDNREKPIYGSYHLQSGNHFKKDNAEKLVNLNYWGRGRKRSLRISLNRQDKSPIRRNYSPLEMGRCFVGWDGDTTDAHQMFDEMPEREKLSFMPPKLHETVKTNVGCERSEKNKLLRKFRVMCRLLREEEGGINPSKRIDLEAIKVLKERGILPKFSHSVGPVSGVKVGNEFDFRVELVIVGLHSHTINGIDYVVGANGRVLATCVVGANGRVLATCVVAAEGYLDIMVRPDMVIYTGEGGTFGVKENKDVKNQELKRGNLALKNSIDELNFVRVVRGIKPGFGNVNDEGGTKKTVFVYDGLYKVVDHDKTIGPHGKLVFPFELSGRSRL